MTSRGYILSGCWMLMILYWTTDMFPGGIVPAAFCGSYVILELLGFFKRERAEVAGDESELSERQQDFLRKFAEGKEAGFNPDDYDDEDGLQAKIVTIDEDGNPSVIIIKPDGSIETEGNPDPDIVKAAYMLKDSIKDFGPEAIAEELQRQLQKIEEEKED